MAQAALIADTIAGMKRALAKCEDSSGSDEPYLQPTNRGNKLKRKAYHIQDGPFSRKLGPKAYKRSIEHAGYGREILRRNPKRYDEDGDEIDDEESDEKADARAADDNPYAEIRIEELLLPLTSAASLPNHPSLSVPYNSTTLTELAQQACDMVQRERKTLSNAKRLLTKLRGDETWIPCGLLYSESDEAMFDTSKLYNNTASGRASQYRSESAKHEVVNLDSRGDFILDGHIGSQPRANTANGAFNGTYEARAAASSIATNETVSNGTLPPDTPTKEASADIRNGPINGKHQAQVPRPIDNNLTQHKTEPEDPEEAQRKLEDEIVGIVGPEVSIINHQNQEDTGAQETRSASGQGDHEYGAERTIPQEDAQTEDLPGSNIGLDGVPAIPAIAPEAEDAKAEGGQAEAEGDDDSRHVPRRMRTRAQAQAASELTPSTRSDSPESWVAPEIHPIFMMPEAAIPDKDFGLPSVEAEDTRRILMMYVQKQEEVCRGATKLYEGLLELDRKRKTVFKWCKAEGHVGEMSDGEDWYDKEEWGLEDDLRKGHNDDEDENVIQGKKTRGRRA